MAGRIAAHRFGSQPRHTSAARHVFAAGAIGSMRVAGLPARVFDATITGVDRSKFCQADASKCSPGI
jgi:hypothetical protein